MRFATMTQNEGRQHPMLQGRYAPSRRFIEYLVQPYRVLTVDARSSLLEWLAEFSRQVVAERAEREASFFEIAPQRM